MLSFSKYSNKIHLIALLRDSNMTYFQTKNCIHIISNDSFIVGLLTGFSVAKDFTLKCITCDKPLSSDSVNIKSKAVIVDLRLLAPSLIKDHLNSLQDIHKQYAIPICAINSHSTISSCSLPFWIDESISENFIEKLDSYINKYIITPTNTYDEQRNKIRRKSPDRRILFLTPHSVSGKKINGKNRINDKEVKRYSLGDFEIDYNCRTVYLKGKNLELTSKEFKLFILLAEDFEHVCSTEKIIKNLWPNTSRANKSDLYQYMHLLRKKIEKDPEHPIWILTIKGVGYKLQANKGGNNMAIKEVSAVLNY